MRCHNSQLDSLILGANLLGGFPVIFPLSMDAGGRDHHGGENALAFCLLKTQFSYALLQSLLLMHLNF